MHQPLLYGSKAWQTIPAGSLKKRDPSKKHRRQIKSSSRSWRATN